MSYQWNDNSKEDDWHADGYRWRVATGRFREVNEGFLNRLEEVLFSGLYARHHQKITFKFNCPHWYHVTCVGVRNTNAAYECDLCE